MASLQLNHIYKAYPNGAKAVSDFSMEIADGEFVVLVGPSGCGKSTVLHMIAGLEDTTAGELRIDEVVVNDVEPKERDVAMVFQNYALYPSMTVYENMASGLKLRKIPKEEIDARVKDIAKVLGIAEYLDRKPKDMSCGQRQRVALGRALVREPRIFLMDEPLSNLDEPLRAAMRAEICKLHRRLKTTFIYATHDIADAMALADRIVVMKDGVVQQIDSPRNLYRYPCNKFVASFIGAPHTSFLEGRLAQKGEKVVISFDNADVSFAAPASAFDKVDPVYLNGDKKVVIGLRAEHVSVAPKQYPYKAKCRVFRVEDLGADCLVYADFNLDNGGDVTDSATRVVIKSPAESEFNINEVTEVSINLDNVIAFDSETDETIAPRIPAQIEVKCNVKARKLRILNAELVLPQAMQANDGDYAVTIPTTAVTIGGDIPVEVLNEEVINGKRIFRLKAGDDVIFALRGLDANLSAKIGVSIDLKQITLSQGGNVKVAALNCDNILEGKINKRKIQVETEVKGKMRKVSDYEFSLEVGGASFPCPQLLSARLSSGTRYVFDKQLQFRFSPYVARIAETGIAATVTKIADYGGESFAVCQVGESTVNVCVPQGFAQKSVALSLDVEQLAIIDPARGIRLA